MTFFGFLVYAIPLCILLSMIDLVTFTPTPSWVHLMIPVSLFIYQTCDNMDGRQVMILRGVNPLIKHHVFQARRTGTSSPLGEFFDHGVDSILITASGLGVLPLLGLGMRMIPLLLHLLYGLMHVVLQARCSLSCSFPCGCLSTWELGRPTTLAMASC